MAKIKIKGVKAYVSKGKVYAYHRKTGTLLRSVFGTAEFFAELAAIEASMKTGKVAPKPGTWGALVIKYKEHRLPQLARRTQTDYHKILDWFSVLDDMPLPNWNRGFAIQLRDKAFKQHGRRFANYVIAVGQAVFTWGLERNYVHEHPLKDIKAITRPKQMVRASRPWSREEWNVVISEAPKHLLAPILLCGVLGWREGEAITDCVMTMIATVSASSGCRPRAERSSERGCQKWFMMHSTLCSPHDAVTMLVNSRGTSWTENGFRSSVFKFLGRLEAERKVEPGLTIHGLRHTCGTLMRELGFDKDTIADMLGQQDAGMAEWYARDADLERKLDGVVKRIDRHLNNKSARRNG
jgi:integrase